MPRLGHHLLEAMEILGGIEQAVRVVDAKPGDLPRSHQRAKQPVGRFEDLRLLHPQANQLVDIEEPAIVDFVDGRSPIGEAVRLMLEQGVQPVEARSIAGDAVGDADRRLDVIADRGRVGHQANQALARHFLLPLALDDSRGVPLGIGRQVLQRGEDTEVLAQCRVPVESLLQPIDVHPEHTRRLTRIDRQVAVEIPQVQRPVLETQLQLAALEHPAVLITEERQQHLAFQFGFDRLPVDVEILGVRRARAVLEHIAPPSDSPPGRRTCDSAESRRCVRIREPAAPRTRPCSPPPSRAPDSAGRDRRCRIRGCCPASAFRTGEL